MNVYDFLKTKDRDFDFYDSELDICITLGLVDGDDPYAMFVRALCQSAIFVEQTSSVSAEAKWSQLIRSKITRLKQYSRKYWQHIPADEDEFIYLWINELGGYASGNLPEDAYCELFEIFEPEDSTSKTAVFNT